MEREIGTFSSRADFFLHKTEKQVIDVVDIVVLGVVMSCYHVMAI